MADEHDGARPIPRGLGDHPDIVVRCQAGLHDNPLARPKQLGKDLGGLIGRFAFGVDKFGEAGAEGTVMIDAGVTDVFVGEGGETLGGGPNYVQDSKWIQVSDATGQFDIELVGPGVYQVQASADNYAWLWSDPIRVA